jgi:hypothetical protein
MTAWFVAAIPLLIMFFALGMERVEARLRQGAVAEKDVEEFLEQARPDEVRALFRQGIGRALELFRLRRRRRPFRSSEVAALRVRDQQDSAIHQEETRPRTVA